MEPSPLYCAVGGVQPQSETVWRQSERYEVPKIAFVNKMDRIGADFYAVIENIQEMLGANPVPVTIPIGASEDFIGIIDLISMKALIFKDEVMGAEWDETEIPAELADTAAEWRNNLVEKCAEQDETLMEKYFEEGDLTEAELWNALYVKQHVRVNLCLFIVDRHTKTKGFNNCSTASIASCLPQTKSPQSPAAKMKPIFVQ